jgi:putative endonuclease
MHARSMFGAAGERMAARHLEGQGFEIVDRNFRCREGEIDLVAAQGELVVFCEVKTRRTDRWGEPSEAVDWRKQAKLRRLAGAWLAENGGRAEVRFDVISIVVESGRPTLVHLPDAF